MIITEELLKEKGFADNGFCYEKDVFDYSRGLDYTINAYEDEERKGCFVVEVIHKREMVRLVTDSVERINVAMSMLKIRDRLC